MNTQRGKQLFPTVTQWLANLYLDNGRKVVQIQTHDDKSMHSELAKILPSCKVEPAQAEPQEGQSITYGVFDKSYQNGTLPIGYVNVVEIPEHISQLFSNTQSRQQRVA